MGLAFILILFFIFVIVWPLWKLWRIMGAIKKRQQEVINQMFGVGPDDDDPRKDNSRKKGGWSRPIKRRKKIAEDVGDYIKFSEVRIEHTTTRTGTSQAEYTEYTETQIEDIEWTDLPK